MAKKRKTKANSLDFDKTYYLPEQDTSFNTKLKEDWYIPTADYYINLATKLNDSKVIEENLMLAKGEIPRYIYEAVNTQLGKLNEDITDLELGSDLIEDGLIEDLMTPIKNRYMGEFMIKSNNYSIVVEDADAVMLLNQKVKVKLYRILTRVVVQYIQNMQQQQQGEEGIEISEEMIKALIEKEKKKHFEEEGEQAKDILDYTLNLNRIEEIIYQLAYYTFATNYPVIYFKLDNNKIKLEIVPPTEALRVRSDNNLFIEDDDVFVRRRFISINRVVSEYGNDDLLSKKDIDYLKEIVGKNDGVERSNAGIMIDRTIINTRYNTSPLVNQGGYFESHYNNKDSTIRFSPRHNEVEHYHVVFKTGLKIKVLHYLDILGSIQEKEVDNSYTLNEENGDLKLESIVKYEYWEIDRFGDRFSGIYTKPRPIIVQRDELGSNGCKSVYNGMSSLLNDFGITPIPKRVAPLLALYHIVTKKLLQEIASYQGYINTIPESLLSDSAEMTQIERLTQLYRDKLLIINDSEANANILQALNSIGSNSQAQYLDSLYGLRDKLKYELRELADMNPERYGNVDTRGGKAVTEEAIQRISVGTIPLHTMFEIFLERVYQAIIDYVRLLSTDGIKLSFSKNDKLVEVDLDYEELLHKQIGVFVVKSQRERMKLERIRESVAQAAAQNAEFGIMAEVLDSENMQELKKYMKDVQKINETKQQAQQQAEQELSKYIEDTKAMVEEAENETKKEVEHIKGEYSIRVETIRAGIAISTMTNTGEGENPLVQEAKDLFEREKELANRSLEERKLAMKEKELNFKEKKRISDEKIAKMNKN